MRGVWKVRERWRRKLVGWGGAERRIGRGQNERSPLTKTMMTGHAKFTKEKTTPKNRDTCDIQEDTTLKVSPGPSHDLVKDEGLAKVRSKEEKRKVKKEGLGGYSNQSAKHHLLGQGTMPAPMSPLRKWLCQLRG